MGTKLGLRERETFLDIFSEDFKEVRSAVARQIEKIWDKARDAVLKELGQDKLIAKKNELNHQIRVLQEEVHQLESQMKIVPLTKQQVLELGGDVDRYGYAKGAEFYGIPIVSQFEYQVVDLIRENIDLEAPAKFLFDLSRSCTRELGMVGTFEEAQEVYNKFYSLDFKKYGVDIAPRLAEIKSKNPLLEPPKTLQVEMKVDAKKIGLAMKKREARLQDEKDNKEVNSHNYIW